MVIENRNGVTDEEFDQAREWATPSHQQVLDAKSRVVARLAGEPTPRTQLISDLLVKEPRSTIVLTGGVRLFDRLSEESAPFANARAENALVIALHELEADGVVVTAPRTVPATLSAPKIVRGNSTTSGGRGYSFTPLRTEPGVLELAYASRHGAIDHKAFIATEYKSGSRARLITQDGEILLEEALAAHRSRRYLSSTFMLGAFVESIWLEAASLAAPTTPPVQQAINRQPFPVISSVVEATLGAFRNFHELQLSGAVRSFIAVRNVIGHGAIVNNRTGNITESASALRIIDGYRHLEDLELALQDIRL